MKALSLANAKSKFSEVITDAEHKKERILIEKGLWGKACRVDVVAIVLTRAGEVARLTHYCAV